MEQVRVMLPLMDMINHGNREEANLKLFRDENGDYIAYTTRAIKKGEEVRKSHSSAYLLYFRTFPEPLVVVRLNFSQTRVRLSCLY